MLLGYGHRPQYAASQTSQFQDFLLRANKYRALQIFNDDKTQRKAILVEVNKTFLYSFYTNIYNLEHTVFTWIKVALFLPEY